jgi:hypothetical protein
MHFIEELFGMSPDASNGSLECLLCLLSVGALYGFSYGRRRIPRNSTERHVSANSCR